MVLVLEETLVDASVMTIVEDRTGDDQKIGA